GEKRLEQRNPQLFPCSVVQFLCDALDMGLHRVSSKLRSKVRTNLCLCEPLPHEREDFCLSGGESSACSYLVKALASFLLGGKLFKRRIATPLRNLVMGLPEGFLEKMCVEPRIDAVALH